MDVKELVYLDVAYCLGANKKYYKDIEGYLVKLKQYGMPDMPKLWGLGYYRENDKKLGDFIRSSIVECVDKTNAIEKNNAIILCCPNTFDKDLFVSEALAAIADNEQLNSNFILPISHLDCTALMVGVELGVGLLNQGFDSVTIMGSEIIPGGESRLTKFAVYSDYLGMLVLSKKKISNYLLRDAASYTVSEDISGESVSSFDNANRLNFESLSINTDKVKMIHGMSLFLPISGAIYKKLGFHTGQINLGLVSEYSHCGGMDPFISMLDRGDEYKSGEQLLLNTQGAGRSSILSLEYMV